MALFNRSIPNFSFYVLALGLLGLLQTKSTSAGLLNCPEGTLRFCTVSDGEQEKCGAMSAAFSTAGIQPNISCCQAQSHGDCIKEISAGNADLVTLDGGDIYTAGKYYDLVPVMGETYEIGDANYWAVAVARADTSFTINDLKDKKSCHTGIMKTAGWIVPVGFLSENDHIDVKNCDSATAVGGFFNQSCAPGALSEKYNPDGTNPESLCQLCIGVGKDNYCARNDHEPYYDYSGAFRCLAERAGDVAFIKHVTVDEYAGSNKIDVGWNANLTSSDFRYLCPDGTHQENWSEDCSLSKVASHALMTSGKKSAADKSQIKSVFTQGQERYGSDDGDAFKLFDSSDYEGSDLLFKDSTQSLIDVGNRTTYDTWLSKEYIEGIRIQDQQDCIPECSGQLECPEGTLRFCTVSSGEQEKCKAMSAAFSSAGITPIISCFQTEGHSDCIKHIEAGNADLVTLDGGDIYTAGKYYDLVPVMGETYEIGDANYWAVAVTRDDTSFTINDLKDKKSCHTGILKTAGWIVPVGFLSENDHIEVKNCDSATAVGEFFSKSCAPGALSEKYNANGTNPKSLCQLCAGEGDDYCVRNDHEPYYDYSGAFRCLVEGAGDVAFIKHVTVDEYTGDNKKDEGWNANLQSSDFHYLCPDGTRQENWSEACSLSKVASHALMTSGDKSDADKSQIRSVFNEGQMMYGSDGGNGFKLFDSSDYEGSDLLFKDSTVSLNDVGNRDTYNTWLSEEYLEGIKIQDQKECSGSVTNKVTVFGLFLGLIIAQVFGGVA